VYKQLDETLFTWDTTLQGVLLKFYDLKITKKCVEIVDEQNVINIPVSYNAIYFCPVPGNSICNLVILNIS
jgi:hypothetical protein